MPLLKRTPDLDPKTDDFHADVHGGLVAVTIGDVRKALVAGFTTREVEYMLDLPEGRVAGLSDVAAFA